MKAGSTVEQSVLLTATLWAASMVDEKAVTKAAMMACRRVAKMVEKTVGVMVAQTVDSKALM